MHQHPIIRDELARFHQENLLRDGAQASVPSAQRAARRRHHLSVRSAAVALAARLSVRVGVSRRHA